MADGYLRTKKHTLTADSSSSPPAETIKHDGIGGAIQAVSVVVESGTAEIQGRASDDWVTIPSGGIDFNVDLTKGNLPKVRASGSATAEISLFYHVKNRS